MFVITYAVSEFVILFVIALGQSFGAFGLFEMLEETCLLCKLKRCSGSSNVPVSLDACGIAGGMSVPGPVARGDCFPSWTNMDKFLTGQRFFSDHYGKIGLDELFTLIGLLAIPQMTDVLLFTATNDCPMQAEKRYPTTSGNILLWGKAHIDIPGNLCAIVKSIQKVRNVHAHAAQRVRSVTAVQGNLGNEARFSSQVINDTYWDAFHQDLNNSYPAEAFQYPACYTDALEKYVPLNQFQYAMTQWSFNAMLSISLNRSLLHASIPQDVEAFNHFWGVVGHMMGIDDNYNIALQPNATALRNMSQSLLQMFVIPSLYNVSHVSKYFMELTHSRSFGIGIPLGLSLFYNGTLPSPLTGDIFLLGLCRIVLNIECPTLYAAATLAGKGVADGIGVVIRTGSLVPALEDVTDLVLNPLATAEVDYWGNKYFGVCYDDWITNCQKAENLHYLYNGPYVNPDGVNSTQGYCPSTPPQNLRLCT